MELRVVDYDLREILESTIRSLAIQAHKKGIEVLLHIKPNVPTNLKGDSARLIQVIVNLLGNAIKFTEHGEISVCVEVEPYGSVKPFAAEDDDDTYVSLRFTVADTGIGIPKDKVTSIFDSFTQLESSYQRMYSGTGLGLSISKQIVNLMGGNIWVESKESSGSHFIFTSHFTKYRVNPRESSPSRAVDFKDVKIIVVDDNATSRLILKEMLATWGFDVEESDSADEALSKLEKASLEGRPFRIVLTDCSISSTNGNDLIKNINLNPNLKDTKIILMFPEGLSSKRSELSKLETSGYVTKPIPRNDLFSKITRILCCTTQKPDSENNLFSSPAVEGGLSIILAEDNILNQKVAVHILEKRGYSVVIVNNGRELLKTLETQRFDIILMDVRMPIMDGIEATKIIRSSQIPSIDSQIPIIALTAHAMKGDKERFLETGMNDYISKPFHANEFIEVIEKHAPETKRKSCN